MRATVATPAPDFTGWELGHDLDKTLHQNLQDAAKIAFDEVWGGLEIQMNTGWPAVGWLQAATSSGEDFAYFSFEAIAREAVWEIATNYGAAFREQHAEETKSHLKAARDELLKAVKIFDDAIAAPLDATSRPSTNPLDYATPEQVEQLKRDCNGLAYSSVVDKETSGE